MAEEFPQESGRTATQRGSLKQVNATLMAQTEVLRDTQTSILSTNNLLTKSLEGQLKAASMTRLKDIEKDREGGKFKAVAGGISTAGSKVAGAAQGGLGSLQGMMGKIGSFLTPAALMALPGILGRVLLKRGIPALAVGIFADEISNFLLGPEASGELKDQVARAIQFGAAGSLLGKRFALIGAAAGFLIDDEVAKQMLEVGKSFGNLIGADIKNLDDLKGVMTSIGVFLRDNLGKGLEGINKLLNGDIKSFLGIGEEGGGNLLATLGTLAGLGLVFAPGSTLKLALAAPGILLWGSKKMLGAISMLGGLATSIVSSTAGSVPLTGPDGKPKPGGKPKGKFPGMIFKKGAGLVMAGASFLGPAGLLIAGTAVLGGFAISALADARREQIEADYKAAGVDQEYIPGYTDAPDMMSSEFGDMDGGTTLSKENEERLRLLEISRDGTKGIDRGIGSYLFGMSTEERLAAKQAEIEAEKMLRVMNRPKIPTADAATSKPMIVDGSVNTTNNIGQSNTTLSAPPPSAGQTDDYSGALRTRASLLVYGAP